MYTSTVSRVLPLRRPKRSFSRRREVTAAYTLLAPFLIVFAALLIVPLVYAGYLSLFKSQLIGGQSFVGVDQYVRALSDPRFLAGLGRTTLFLFIQVPIMLALALFVALALDSGRVRLAKLSRLLVFIPFAVPGVVAALMWGYMYGERSGLIAQTLKGLGLPSPDLLSSNLVLGSMMNIATWEYVGYNMIILYAALQAVPRELYEAATIDGAGQFRIAWSVKIPSILPALLLTVIFSIIGTFQLFNEPALLKIIAPNAISNDYTPNFYAYNLAFIDQDVNYAAAISFLLGFVIAVVSYGIQLSTQRRWS